MEEEAYGRRRWQRGGGGRGSEKLSIQCNDNPIYVFPEKELHGFSPNFHINVSVSDSYIGPHIFMQQKGRPIVRIFKSLTDI